eukprot:s259_g43.t2
MSQNADERVVLIWLSTYEAPTERSRLRKWAQAAVSVFSERPFERSLSGEGSGFAGTAPRLVKQSSEQWSADSEQIAQALGYVARIDLKMVPPNAREELEIIEKLNDNFNPEAPGKAGDLWYLIPARWWKQWLEFTSTETNSREQGPPSIDNSDLVDARDFLRIGLSEGVDYEARLFPERRCPPRCACPMRRRGSILPDEHPIGAAMPAPAPMPDAEDMPELPRLMGRISLRLDRTEASKASSTSKEEDHAVYQRALEAERERQSAWKRWASNQPVSATSKDFTKLADKLEPGVI